MRAMDEKRDINLLRLVTVEPICISLATCVTGINEVVRQL